MSAWSNEEMADSTQNTQGFASNGENPFGIVGYGIDSYGQAFADVYDAWYQDLGDDDFVALVAASLPTRPVRILELGIGTGRLVTALQSLRGDIADHIVGIDSSTAMLDIARRNLSPMVNLVHGDFTETLPEGPFDAIFVGYNTLFNVADEEALRACLDLVASRLGPEGEFFVDVVTAPQQPSGDHIGIRSMTASDVVISISRHDAHTQQINGQFVHFVDGQPLRLRPWAIRYFSPSQLDQCATSAGLVLTRRLGDGHGLPFDPSGARHISTYTLARTS